MPKYLIIRDKSVGGDSADFPEVTIHIELTPERAGELSEVLMPEYCIVPEELA